QQLQPLLLELQQQVRDCSIQAVDVLERLTPLMQGQTHAKQLNALSQAVRGYDFDRAQELLDKLLD
ncbi:MAG: hypothetical protein HQL47_09035, partial [Gammaproteobacteria bacterium]|nr:hypothetical protein [Gammaproteobacteria bacterium]